MPSRRSRTGLVRLADYLPERRLSLVVLAVASALTPVASVGGWLVVRDAVDEGIRAGDRDRLLLDVAVYVALNLLAWALASYMTLALARLGQEIVFGLRRHLFRHLTSLSLGYFSRQRTGWIISRLTNDVDAVSDMLSQGLRTLVGNGLTLIVSLAALFVLDVRLGAAVLLVVPFAIALTRWFQRRSIVAFGEVRTRIATLTAQLAESVAGMAVVQAFNRERAFQAEFGELNEANRAANVDAQRLSAVFFPAVEFLGIASTALAILIGAHLVADDTLTIGTLIAFIGLLQLLFQPLQELSELYGQVQSAGAAMGKISTVLDASPDIEDRPDALPLDHVEGRLDLDGVTFAYGDEPVLHDVELHVPAGGCVAIVGESGGGKSTTARLVSRFYDPSEGSVRVDGHDLRDVRLESYRRRLGIVLQEPFLFAGTLADNVRFARPEATDAEVEEVARAVGLDRVAARFPDGLAHEVRERGSGLSAGERQLVSIARALLADPRILILDEATSNIDRPSEVLIERALDRLLHGRTSLIIAHRLSTVRRADEIVVMEHGRIVQRGSEQALLAEDGPFRRLAHVLAHPVADVGAD